MKLRLLLTSLCLALGAALRAAPVSDPAFTNGLQTFVSNGLEAGLRTWYPDRPAAAASANEALLAATRNFGEIIDAEVVAVQTVSKRVTRYYVALYYTVAPVWIRIERYQSPDRVTYLPLKFSLRADEILPGYLTDFHP